MQVEVRFIKKHDDAQLPKRKNGNRSLNPVEKEFIDRENEQFQQSNPEAYANGYRVGFPFERDENGNLTDRIIGTGDTGYDVYCVEDKIIPAKGSAVVATGVELAYITPGFWFMIAPRSGLGFKNGIQPHLGTVDNPYRGDLSVKLYNFSDTDYEVKKGDRIAQLVFYPVIEPIVGWADTKLDTDRSDSGFGSSGK